VHAYINTHISYEIFPDSLYNYFAFHSSSFIILSCGNKFSFYSYCYCGY